jgi:hypothetical protein
VTFAGAECADSNEPQLAVATSLRLPGGSRMLDVSKHIGNGTNRRK